MFYNDAIWMAKNENPIYLLPKMANRHGLVTGATGTGKTITIKVMAEAFSDAGVSVFLSDIKGDLTGMSVPGNNTEDMQKRIEKFGLNEAGWEYKAYPTTYWDVFGKKGTPIRATVSEMGPMLLSRLMGLTDVQEGVLTIIFKIADDQNLLILDLKDLRAVVQAVGDNAADYKTTYGNITTASIGAIQRGLLKLEEQGANQFFGEPALEIMDWIRTDADGRGMINVLNCEQLFQQPDLYSAFLLWMLSELYETLPEVGDLDKPKIVFFFDEAHILFDLDSKELLSKVEQVVRLIRSKGVGVYFISQSPTDIPNSVLGQLGNKIQHALRAYTPADQKAVRAAAQSFVVNPEFKTEEAITQLGTGEALVSFLDEKGTPTMVQRAKILPPQSLMGACDEAILQQSVATSDMGVKYNVAYDRESAYELLTGKSAQGVVIPDAVNSAAVQPSVMAQQQVLAQQAQTVAQAQAAQYAQQPVTPQPAPAEGLWDCKCGQTGNPGNFCMQCGQPRNQGFAPGTAPSISSQAVNDNSAIMGAPSGTMAASMSSQPATQAAEEPTGPSLVQAAAAQREAQAAESGTQATEPSLVESQQGTTLTQEELEQLKKDAVKEAKEELKKEKEAEKAAAKEAKEAEKAAKEAAKKKEKQKQKLQKAATDVLTSAGKTAANKLVRGLLGNLLK